MLFALLVFGLSRKPSYNKIYSCKIDESVEPVIQEGYREDADAVLYWNNSLSTEGFYKLVIEGREGSDPYLMMHCAGVLEGYVTQHQIYQHFCLQKDQHNFSRNEPIPSNWYEWLNTNMQYTLNTAASEPSAYWHQVKLIMSQFKGLMVGYNMSAPASEPMSPVDFWFIEAECELWDIEYVVNPAARSQPKLDTDHCTALIRVPSDNSDIFFAHDTWSDFRCMHNQLKEYHFPIPEFTASRVLMSTRIGKLFSYDDFYMADTGLLVMETTLSVFNTALYDEVKTHSLLTWVRAIRAMWMTDNGRDWTNALMEHNSGTLNNQYLVLDTKKWTRYEEPKDDLLWLIEQMPGAFERLDISNILRKQGFWPSFNVPYTEKIYKISGVPEIVAEKGKSYSYYESARYQILAREAPKVQSFEDFKRVMLHNEWKSDPFSQGDPGQAIAARYDLRNGTTPFGVQKAFGMIDAKCSRLTETQTKLRFHAKSGPTHQNNPPWEFGVYPYEDIQYDGLPQKWTFDWTIFESNTFDLCNSTEKETCMENRKCGWCGATDECYAGDAEGPFMETCESGWSHQDQKLSALVITAIVVGSVVSVVLIGVLGLIIYHKRGLCFRSAKYEVVE